MTIQNYVQVVKDAFAKRDSNVGNGFSVPSISLQAYCYAVHELTHHVLLQSIVHRDHSHM